VAIFSAGIVNDKSELGVSFYFAAHQDDWQLFMNPSAFLDVVDRSTKTVFIHMTAGDAGLGAKRVGRKHPLYFAREQGAEAAIRFMADADNREPIEPSVAAPDFNGRPIRRVCYRNTVAYFLRLPDGSPAGIGYSDTRHQSLRRLAEAQAGIAAIDETAVLAFDHPMSWRHYNRGFIGRNYFRVEEPSPDVGGV
jgi:hypothetical protein